MTNPGSSVENSAKHLGLGVVGTGSLVGSDSKATRSLFSYPA